MRFGKDALAEIAQFWAVPFDLAVNYGPWSGWLLRDRLHVRWPPTKESIGALAAAAAFLIVSVAFGRQETLKAYKYQADPRTYAELAKAPEKARAKRNPLETDPQAIAAGRNLFEQHCAECHGNTADGSSKASSLRVEEVQGAAPGAIFWILTNGVVRRGMPVWSKLPEPQRWQLVTFIKSLGPPSPNSIDKKSP